MTIIMHNVLYLGLPHFSSFIADRAVTVKMRYLLPLADGLWSSFGWIGVDPFHVFLFVERSKAHDRFRAASFNVILRNSAAVAEFILPPTISLSHKNILKHFTRTYCLCFCICLLIE